jgi:hypothetical protein
MGINEILMSLPRRKSGRGGLWDCLSERAAGKNRVQLEGARNKGRQEVIRALERGGVLREGGPDWPTEIMGGITPGAAWRYAFAGRGKLRRLLAGGAGGDTRKEGTR